MGGWIKIHRQMLDNKLWELEPFTKAQAWIDLLMITNHKESCITLRNGEIVNLQRGECGYSKLSLAKRWKWSRNKVSRFIDFLISEKMIQQKDISKTTILVILNFDKYQNDTTNETSNDTSNDTTNETSNDTLTRKVKNVKNEKNIKENIKRKVYGEFENVFLSDDEYSKLKFLYFDKFDNAINILSSYLESTGKKYKSYYAVLGKHNWVYKKCFESTSEPKIRKDYEFKPTHTEVRKDYEFKPRYT